MKPEVRYDLLHQLWELMLSVGADPEAMKHWDMGNWFGRRGGYDSDAFGLLAQTVESLLSCGTVGCAIGFGACAIPEIQARLQIMPGGMLLDSGDLHWYEPAVIATLLGISELDAERIFLPIEYAEHLVLPEHAALRLAQTIIKYANLEAPEVAP